MWSSTVPDGVPVLSRGRHRSPRRGACFMELASVLAGERWSDDPPCTHPLLSQLARSVNDQVSDAGRQALLPLVPSVVGRHGDRWTALRLAVAVAARAVPDAPEDCQRVLAAGLLRAEQLCADQLGADGPPELAGVARAARRALDLVPGATAWAEELGGHDRITLEVFERRSAPVMVRHAVAATAQAAGRHLDARLRELLEAGLTAADPALSAPCARMERWQPSTGSASRPASGSTPPSPSPPPPRRARGRRSARAATRWS